VERLPGAFSLENYSAAIVAASVHRARHEREIVDFVKKNRAALEGMPAAFLSVSLSEAGAEDETAPAERRAQAGADVRRMIEAFLAETGWHPGRIKAVAGALLYTRYNFLLRFIMKRIASQAGGGTDVSRDYDYTNWANLDEFVDELARALPGPIA
jgi:menaquinone-dependent protoporphyrinogen oxidase